MVTSISLRRPFLKLRNKEQTLYCFSEEERDAAVIKLKKNIEITRFKGLGEINPDEFKQFIGPRIRLQAVRVNHFGDIKPTLLFYMGKNTPERRQFIMENLINEVSEIVAAQEEQEAESDV